MRPMLAIGCEGRPAEHLARVPGTDDAEGRAPWIPTTSCADLDREQWWEVTGVGEIGWST